MFNPAYRVDIKFAETLTWFDIAMGDDLEMCQEQLAYETETGLYRIVERKSGKVIAWRRIS